MSTETPRRETYPLVTHDDTLVIVHRDHILTDARPVLFLKAHIASEVRLDSSYNLDDRPGIRVFDYTNGAGDSITLTVDGSGTTLTEGVDFTASTSNAVTAMSIADAINAASIGLTATAQEDLVFTVPDLTVKTLVITTSDSTAWDVPGLAVLGPTQTLVAGETVSLTLPAGVVFDPLRKVSFLRVLSGRVSADLRSFGEVRTYFRQPSTLSGSTGSTGGWPKAPDPPPLYLSS